MRKAYKNILVVVKQTPYEQYMQLKAQGKAPVALRWERLKNRFSVHKQCVDDVTNVLEKTGVQYTVIRRDDMHRGTLVDKDLVIAVGGDGTILNTSSFIDDSIPVLGVNSDPTRPEEQGVTNVKDERRSRGALCAASAFSVHSYLPKVIYGDVEPGIRTRIQCIVRSTYTETRLPPALNDILVAHPIPAAVSRFRLALCSGLATTSYQSVARYEELFSFNVWSSGIWISTATGSTAAMFAAGGQIMDLKSQDLQYRVREHLLEGDNSCTSSNNPQTFSPSSSLSYQQKAGQGMIRPEEMLLLRWNSQFGRCFVDGSHLEHQLELGDEIKIDGHAPSLRLFNYDPEEDARCQGKEMPANTT